MHRKKCVCFQQELEKVRKGANKKTRHNPAFCGERSLVGHSIQIWNHSGLDHKREITLHSDFTLFFLCWEVV